MPCSAEQMFDLVNDVEAYSDFLPWCSASEVLESSGSAMVARLTLSKAGVDWRFTTRNRLERPGRIFLTLVDGPFSFLEGDWQFHRLANDGCKVEMCLQFDFKSSLLKSTLGSVFSRAADTLVDAFCARANQVYGRAKHVN